jgi:hypothetical protein
MFLSGFYVSWKCSYLLLDVDFISRNYFFLSCRSWRWEVFGAFCSKSYFSWKLTEFFISEVCWIEENVCKWCHRRRKTSNITNEFNNFFTKVKICHSRKFPTNTNVSFFLFEFLQKLKASQTLHILFVEALFIVWRLRNKWKYL